MKEILLRRIRSWIDDPDSAVVYWEQVGNRWAVRVEQEARDATTVWFRPMDRSLEYEAYVIPFDGASVGLALQALRRNMRSWRAFFAVDDEDGLVLRGRMAASEVTMENLDLALGEVVEAVEVAFRPLLRQLTTDRENSV